MLNEAGQLFFPLDRKAGELQMFFKMQAVVWSIEGRRRRVHVNIIMGSVDRSVRGQDSRRDC